MSFIPYGRQEVTEADIAAVTEVLRSDFLTQGPAVEAFEADICIYTGAKHAVACSNGTAALHLAALAARVQPGDIAIVPAITFAASANCISYCGGEVWFADVNDGVTLDINSCRTQIERAIREGRRVSVVVTVDMAGNRSHYEGVAALRREFGFTWISDACHRLVPNELLGENGPDMAVLSFHPVKHITTGEGGMVLTNQESLAKALRLYRSHGITKASEDFVAPEQAWSQDGTLNPWYYEMQALGYNYRMCDIQAALGRSQLTRLNAGLDRRDEIMAAYWAAFKNLEHVSFPEQSSKGRHGYHLAVLLIDFALLDKSRAQVMTELRELGIGTQVHYIPVCMLPYYAGKTNLRRVSNAVYYYARALSVPCFASMSDSDIERVIAGVTRVIGGE